MRALGVFAKWPEPGQVKTRLAKLLGMEEAAKAAKHFLTKTLDKLAAIDGARFLVYSPTHSQASFAPLARGRFALVPQSNGDLGQRLAQFFASQFAAGAQRVVAVGTDSPTLPRSFVEQAFDRLSTADVCLGPATDGGYYLLGCRRWLPSLFTDVEWSTPRLLKQTVARIKRESASLALLPPWYDVDTPDEWQMLQGHLLAMHYERLCSES